jgi:hypothetical protein
VRATFVVLALVIWAPAVALWVYCVALGMKMAGLP